MNNSSGRDVLILIAIVVVVVVVWISSKPEGSESRYAKTVSQSSELSLPRNTSIQDPRAREREKQKETRYIEREIKQAQRELEKVQEELEKLEKFGDASPYKGQVTIVKRSTGPRSRDINKEYIELRASAKNTGVISLRGWRLRSAVSGRSVEIKKASYFPYLGQVNTELPVNLKAGDKVFVTTGRSPIGVSFRVNKCSGYYQQFQKFTPRLKEQCPDPEDEILSYEGDPSIFIDNACMDFVERIPRCEIKASALPKELSFMCQQAIIDEISYNSCITKHKDDSDFIQPQWRIYLKREVELWRDKREIITLLDQNGKTVDIYAY